MSKKISKFVISKFQVLAVVLFRLITTPFIKRSSETRLNLQLLKGQPVVFAANHTYRLDPPAIFSTLSNRDLISCSKMKFMTGKKIYYSMLPILYLTGCYPTKWAKHAGVKGSIYYLKQGYKVFIFPEGRLNPGRKKNIAHNGISRILSGLESPRLILVRAKWTKGDSLFCRYSLHTIFSEVDANIDIDDPKQIMDAIYAL